MKNQILSGCLGLVLLFSCAAEQSRVIEDFNDNWKFKLGERSDAMHPDYDDVQWRVLRLPHDWSIELGYQKEGTAASTGFVPGGIGWYRKSFMLPKSDENRTISIEFDGIYNNSSVWINGHLLGTRPYGYSSFSYNLSEYLNFGDTRNIIAVKVDRSAYIDSRWYTGSGIYRNVRLVRTEPLHIAHWGVQISTRNISEKKAEVIIQTEINNKPGSQQKIELKYSVSNQLGVPVASKSETIDLKAETKNVTSLNIKNPDLWSIENPGLYTAKVELSSSGKIFDVQNVIFGIRSFAFDANTGFSLNGEQMKIKGVNLHHDAGCLGAAVPKDIWEYRVKRLKSIGVNAIRLSHNPHSPELLEVCDEQGILVMAEIFDEWDRPKGKNLNYIGDNAAPAEESRAYPEEFNEWGERDLKDLIKRDFNHPSVIMWSIGNEIEWTFPDYPQAYKLANGETESYITVPDYDSLNNRQALDKLTGGNDTLVLIANKLVKWAKEIDTTRPITCGNVLPSIDLASGYADAVDVMGFNYRAVEYDAAHKTYPDLKIIGSENWVAYSEWKNCVERDFVAGIFLWTGFAYLGEAGPWPRKGLNISLFDFAGFKNPRGHFFECLWKEEPKVYLVTTPADESEFSFNKNTGWEFNMQMSAPPVWKMLRLWEWYKVYPKWNYSDNDDIVVQAYTNCEQAELFLNGTSLGKQERKSFAEDNIIKWLVPYSSGELKIVGFNKGEQVAEYQLQTNGNLARIEISTNKSTLLADGYSCAVVTVQLIDENNNLITDKDQEIEFSSSGPIINLGVDNGWEYNVSPHKTNKVKTHQGKAIMVIQSKQQTGAAQISASAGAIKSSELTIPIE